MARKYKYECAMSRRTENRFREREVSRALKAARKAQAEVDRVEIDPVTGRISVILAKPQATQESAAAKQWLDATDAIVKAKKGSKSAPTRR